MGETINKIVNNRVLLVPTGFIWLRMGSSCALLNKLRFPKSGIYALTERLSYVRLDLL
jgi:hypothetical protein